ncbi:nuclear transport factor 2 family protein [Rhodococcus sp. BP-252]|uniref:nuclear transport factor 2 family protein n=1 Tax=unclassified Rhodococcus (in: high G+C Gram-positive bacteria) TaxID=192944 RepID=UPI001C9B322F|nr:MULTISPECIES: nuclear transport factor 2 family protein [unclassified Rhodococcus (in: high G+C Gram-positive bacteria)]MBY6412605.1 nuclear transport factor 2 family protein [Rhodococcus sp. BP-320]MBY6417140.1 nuclear transport factor 2 family protein [Rhodococcus sp. BP-321]MBY6423228.1 nuclear transport factor 2 family protein [Rhodococcus sp. BP-324]MBY6427164.1 nuclear transport factor 2 family protein [Rhodococcus sp. BP-323]MBY6432223.1 nuclear transport factor 2 family protein [Rho
MTIAFEGLVSADLAYRAQAALYSYAWAADSGDLDTLRDMALEDIAVTQSTQEKQGREAFLDIYRAFAASDTELSRHVVTNTVVTNEGDGVRIDAYFEATLFTSGSTSRIFGRYSDSLVEVDGSLKLKHKRIFVDRVMALPVATDAFVPYGSDKS